MRSKPLGEPPWLCELRRSHQGLDVEREHPRALERQERARPRPPRVGAIGETRAVGHLDETGSAHLEEADLVRRAEAVLERAQHPQEAHGVAFEHERRVDEVLEHARAGNRPVLRHVPDEDDRDATILGQTLEARRGLAHLGNRSGSRTELVAPHRLHRVDDAHVGRLGGDRRAHRLESRLGEDADTLHRPEALGAQTHLRRRLLAGHEQHLRAPGEAREQRSRQARLPDARLACEQHERTGYETSAEHSIELAEPGLQAVRMLERNLGERNHDAGEPRRGDTTWRLVLRRALLDEGRPGLAAGAAAEPARLAATALTADEHGAGQPGHGRASLRWRSDGVERGAGQLWLGVATARYRCGCSTASNADSAEISHDCNSPSAPTTSRSSRPETSSQISRTSPPWEVVRDSSSRFMHTVVRQ